jgi:hypothetical protein
MEEAEPAQAPRAALSQRPKFARFDDFFDVLLPPTGDALAESGQGGRTK